MALGSQAWALPPEKFAGFECVVFEHCDTHQTCQQVSESLMVNFIEYGQSLHMQFRERQQSFFMVNSKRNGDGKIISASRSGNLDPGYGGRLFTVFGNGRFIYTEHVFGDGLGGTPNAEANTVIKRGLCQMEVS